MKRRWLGAAVIGAVVGILAGYLIDGQHSRGTLSRWVTEPMDASLLIWAMIGAVAGGLFSKIRD